MSVTKVCNSCDESLSIQDDIIYCPICGEILVRSNLDDEPSSLQLEEASNLFSRELFRPIGASLDSQNSKRLSQSYLKTLGKLTVDDQGLILLDTYLLVGSIRFLAVPAVFCSLSSLMPPFRDGLPSNQSSSRMEGDLIRGEPEFGESEPLTNSISLQRLQNPIVLLKRGKVPFLDKCLTAQRSGARCVVVYQSYDTWPFAMTHEAFSSDRLAEISIPSVMISKEDGATIGRLMNDSSGVLPIALCVSRADHDCVVCREDMRPGCEVLKLSCRHVFHSTW
jgi:hypothetical protein